MSKLNELHDECDAWVLHAECDACVTEFDEQVEH